MSSILIIVLFIVTAYSHVGAYHRFKKKYTCFAFIIYGDWLWYISSELYATDCISSQLRTPTRAKIWMFTNIILYWKYSCMNCQYANSMFSPNISHPRPLPNSHERWGAACKFVVLNCLDLVEVWRHQLCSNGMTNVHCNLCISYENRSA
jgi:hypothetical protein